jgi:hypothetical protein
MIGLPALSHFAYKAFFNAYCYSETTEYWGAVQKSLCSNALVDMEEDMRLDAGIALLAVAFVLGSVVCYRKARRYKPRAPIRPIRPN